MNNLGIIILIICISCNTFKSNMNQIDNINQFFYDSLFFGEDKQNNTSNKINLKHKTNSNFDEYDNEKYIRKVEVEFPNIIGVRKLKMGEREIIFISVSHSYSKEFNKFRNIINKKLHEFITKDNIELLLEFDENKSQRNSAKKTIIMGLPNVGELKFTSIDFRSSIAASCSESELCNYRDKYNYYIKYKDGHKFNLSEQYKCYKKYIEYYAKFVKDINDLLPKPSEVLKLKLAKYEEAYNRVYSKINDKTISLERLIGIYKIYTYVNIYSNTYVENLIKQLKENIEIMKDLRRDCVNINILYNILASNNNNNTLIVCAGKSHCINCIKYLIDLKLLNDESDVEIETEMSCSNYYVKLIQKNVNINSALFRIFRERKR